MSNSVFLKKSLSFFLCFFAFSLFSGNAKAQSFLEIPVRLDIEKGNFDDVIVKVKKEGKDAFTQSGASKLRFKLDFGKKYSLIFTKPGYITKTIEVNTSAPASRISKGFDPYKIGIKLFRQGEDNTVIYNQPVAHIKYDENLDEFNFDTDYSKSILSAVKSTADDTEKEDAASRDKPDPLSSSGGENKSTNSSNLSASGTESPIISAGTADGNDAAPVTAKPVNVSAAEEKRNVPSPIAAADHSLTASINSGGEPFTDLKTNIGEENNKANSYAAGSEIKKNVESNSGNERSHRLLAANSGKEIAANAIIQNSGHDDNNAPDLNFENEKVTRQDIVERNRIITKIIVTKGMHITEYSRINYNWGGLYFFKNNSTSISENLFVQWTGISN